MNILSLGEQGGNSKKIFLGKINPRDIVINLVEEGDRGI